MKDPSPLAQDDREKFGSNDKNERAGAFAWGVVWRAQLLRKRSGDVKFA
ncbi:hypothetical protein IJT93_06165 [bacterium]|nr:hypothetical protein [bacterium]